MTGSIQPKISWDEIEALNTEHTDGTSTPVATEPWAVKARRSQAKWNFERELFKAWPRIYAELKDAFRGEDP